MKCVVSAIAAQGKNREIGSQQDLPWHIPEDFQFFKNTTQSSIVITGRKNFESVPKFLVGRFQIIISRDKNYKPLERLKSPEKSFMVVSDMAQAVPLALNLMKEIESGKVPHEMSLALRDLIYEKQFYKNSLDKKAPEVFVIGGGEVYAQLLPVTERVYLTEIDLSVQAETFFPALGGEFSLTSSRASKALNKKTNEAVGLKYQIYDRIKC